MEIVVDAEKPQEGEVVPEINNNPLIEQQWAVVAFQHAETYLNIITSVKDNTKMKLTPCDDEIYDSFRKEFPTLKVDKVDEDELKSTASKEKWRPFMMSFEKKVELFNFLTLLRLDCKLGYAENNTTVVPRIQFYCIELARLREGLNKDIKVE